MTGPCIGDSGAGLILSTNAKDEKYYLLGILNSGSTTTNGKQPRCDFIHYPIFLNIYKYAYWIKNVIIESLD
jgi:hypothetical protein